MSAELDIVNAMLSTEGVASVTSLDARHPSVRKARPRLERVNKEIQATGWWFNKDYNVGLTPTATKEIVLPADTLSADPVDENLTYRKRGGKMYDPYKQTYAFGDDLSSGKLFLNITLLLGYEELPQEAVSAITAKACRRHAMAEDADPALLRELRGDEIMSFSELKRAHLRQLDVNALRSPQGRRAAFQRRGGYLRGSNATHLGGSNA